MGNKDKLGAFYPGLYVEGDLLRNPRAYKSKIFKIKQLQGQVFTQPVTNGKHLIPLLDRIYSDNKTKEDIILNRITL